MPTWATMRWPERRRARETHGVPAPIDRPSGAVRDADAARPADGRRVSMRERRQPDWPTVACQVDAEERLVTSAPEVPAEGARAIIRELFASGRVPPTTPEGRGAWRSASSDGSGSAPSRGRRVRISSRSSGIGASSAAPCGPMAIATDRQPAPDLPAALVRRRGRRRPERAGRPRGGSPPRHRRRLTPRPGASGLVLIPSSVKRRRR